jgi:hypothetical protein
MPNQTPKKYTGQIIGVSEACDHYTAEIRPIRYAMMADILNRLSKVGTVKKHFQGGYDRADFFKELSEMKDRLGTKKAEWVHRPT